MSVFPVVVDLVTQSAEGPGKYGPFLYNGNRYEILVNLVSDGSGNFNPFFAAYKSTDGGLTWAEVDGAHELAAGVNQPPGRSCPYACCQSQSALNVLSVVYLHPGSGSITIGAFDCATDTWIGLLSDSGITPFLNVFLVAAHRPLSNTILIAYPGDSFTDASSETHDITTLAVYDVAGNAWGTPFDAGYTDYATVIGWHQVPCGLVIDSDGEAHLFMQQVTHGVPLGTFSASPGGFVPWYCSSCFITCLGGGGGGGAVSPLQAGGGGGAGGFSSGTAAVTPLGSFPSAIIGLGGAGGIFGVGGDGANGGSTSCGGVSASGGAGGHMDGTPGGNGGHGWTTGVDAGGGGGGGSSDDLWGSGGSGDDGIIYDGTDGHQNGGNGGAIAPLGQIGGEGGSYLRIYTPGAAGGGTGTGGGGGGGGAYTGGGALAGDGPGGAGGDGEVGISYTATQGTVYASRLWQQAIHADNSLGSLSHIVDGDFAMQNGDCLIVLMPFDCAVTSGKVAICFSGATNTTGYHNIEVMKGMNADPISFAGQVIASGNTTVDPSPALSWSSTGNLFLVSKVVVLPGAGFIYRTDTGSGFGAPATIGLFADPFCRIQTACFLSTPEITFAVPTQAEISFSAVEGVHYLVVLAKNPGTDGDLVELNLISSFGGGTSVSVTGNLITVTVGWVMSGSPASPVTSADWVSIAASINAAAPDLVVATGDPSDNQVPSFAGLATAQGLVDGFASAGAGQYYSPGVAAVRKKMPMFVKGRA